MSTEPYDLFGSITESNAQKLNKLIADNIVKYEWDPLGFVMHMFPWGQEGPLRDRLPRKWQADILEEVRIAIEQGEMKIFVDVASGHGIGKSALISWITIWMVLCGHTKGVITANTGNQLTTKTMPELNKWFGLCIATHWMEYHATSLRRKIGGKGADAVHQDWRVDAIPWSEHNPDAFGGLHNEGARVLVVFDEASGIARIIWETIDGAHSDADAFMLWLRCGNPLRNVGMFADVFRKRPTEGAYTIRRNIDSRTVEGVDVKFIDAKIKEAGGEDSDYAKSRWRGVFPDQSDFQLIPTSDVDESMRRPTPAALLTSPIVAGLDFARAGRDDTVLRFRKGKDGRSHPSKRWGREVGKNSMILASVISMELNKVKPHHVFGDDGGIGGPIMDRLEQLGHRVIRVNAAAKTADPTRWGNMRAEMWSKFGQWLKDGGALPPEGKLREQIIQQEFYFKKDTNVIMLVSKDDMLEEGLHSPDEAEAIIQTFAYDVAPLNDPRDGAGRRTSSHAGEGYDPFS